MNVGFKYKYFLKFIVTLVLCQLAAPLAFAQSSENQQIVVEGSLTDNTGHAINLSGATLVFYITTDKGCYLYGETTTTAGDSDGNIIQRIGSSALVSGSPNSYGNSIFYGAAVGTTTFAGNNCIASPTDTRLVKVYYQAQDISANLKIGIVPYAQNANFLNGHPSVDFVLVSPDTNTVFNMGSAGQYLTRSASGYLTWITPPTLTATASAVASVTAGNGLLGGVITSAGTLSVHFGTSSGTVAAGNDARILGAMQSVNNLGEITSPSLARNNLGLGSLATKSSLNLTTDVSGFLPVANGGSPFQLSHAGPMTASNVAIGSTTSYSNIGLAVTAPAATTNSLIGYFNNEADDGNGVKINVENTSSQKFGLKITTGNGTTTNFTVLNNGNVGIGTATPNARLELPSSTFTTAALKFNSGALLTNPASGSLEYDGTRLYITDDSNSRRTIPTGSTNTSIDNISAINSSGSLTLATTSKVIVNGALGLGVANPASKLHVFSSDVEVARIDGASSGGYLAFSRNSASKGYIGYTNGIGTFFTNEIVDAFSIRSEGPALQLGVGNSAQVTVLSSGRVGIGTTAPMAALTVSGSIRTTASLEFADGTSQTTAPFSTYERVTSNCGSATSCQVTCPGTKKIISGGCSNSGTATLMSTYPVSDTQWFCTWGSGTSSNTIAYAICVKM